VLEAAWAIAEILGDGALRWVDLAARTEWSDPTLRRASGLLQRAGVIALDREAGKWSRVEGVEIPAELLPRFALVAEVKAHRAALRGAAEQLGTVPP
jgi:DNA-binding IclR family transcriptional regulator